MFSVDGTYLGCALQAGEQDLGGPWRIRWCKSTSSLAMVHMKDLRHHISLIQVTSEKYEAMMDEENAKLKEVPEGNTSVDDSVIIVESSSKKKDCAASKAVSKFNWTGNISEP